RPSGCGYGQALPRRHGARSGTVPPALGRHPCVAAQPDFLPRSNLSAPPTRSPTVVLTPLRPLFHFASNSETRIRSRKFLSATKSPCRQLHAYPCHFAPTHV